MKSTTLRCAALIRMSSDSQENSPERQRQAFAAYCVRWDLTPADEYEDLGVSATSTALEHRAGLQHLLADARAHKFDLVWCEEISRIARKGWEFGFVRDVLAAHAIRIVRNSDDPSRGNAEDDELIQDIEAAVARRETRNMARRVRETLRMKAAQGLYRGGRLALGLKWVWERRPTKTDRVGAGHWERDEEAAALATMVFEMFLETRNMEAIAAYMNDNGHRNSIGRLWSGPGVRVLLLGPTYRGLIRCGEELYPCPSLPEIVPPDLVARVDAIFANRKERTARCDTSEWAVFTGLLRCPGCGKWLQTRLIRKANKKPQVVYYCPSGKHQPITCSNRKYMGQASFERSIVPMIRDRLQGLVEEMPTSRNQRGGSKTSIVRQLARLEQERQRVLQQHQRGWLEDGEAEVRLQKIGHRRAELQSERHTSEPRVTEANLRVALDGLGSQWWEWTVPRRRDVLLSLLEYIIPDRDDFRQSVVSFRV